MPLALPLPWVSVTASAPASSAATTAATLTTVRRLALNTGGSFVLLQGVVPVYCAVSGSRTCRRGGTAYETPASSSPSNVKLVTLPSAHWRLFGLCQRCLCSAASRLIQIGSWWLTQIASCPRAASRARSITWRIRAATCVYGSPQDGRKGFHRYRQFAGFSASWVSVTVLPSRTFADSISRS